MLEALAAKVDKCPRMPDFGTSIHRGDPVDPSTRRAAIKGRESRLRAWQVQCGHEREEAGLQVGLRTSSPATAANSSITAVGSGTPVSIANAPLPFRPS